MPLLARYNSNDSLDLCDIETQELVCNIPKPTDSRRSLRWIAERWAEQEVHTIAEWDYSNLTKSTL